MDRENIINDEGKARWRCSVCKGLQEAVDWLSTETSLTVVEQWVVRDALALLKAQEPKMVTGVAEIYNDILVGNCPSCGQTIVSNVKKQTKYCRFCGQGVTFE